MFILGGIITEQAYAEGEMTEKLNRFKGDLFGDKEVILHTADITRNKNGFERIKDTGFRERFCFEMGPQTGGGMIVAEKRGPTLDHQLDLAWLNLKIQGTAYLKAKTIEERIVNITSRHKNENIAGLQIADMIVTPIGRHLMGKKHIYPRFEAIEKKFRKGQAGNTEGAGLVVLPKK